MKTISLSFALAFFVHSTAHAIVGGQLSDPDEYQQIGAVVGGSGIGSFVALSENWVLTAAHVVDTASTASTLLIGGHPDTPIIGEPFFLAEQIILPPDYVMGEFHDDLALIKLSALSVIQPSLHNMSFATLSNVAVTGSLPGTATVTGFGQELVDGSPPAEFFRRSVSMATTTADPFDVVGVAPFPTVFPTGCGGGIILCTYGTTGGAPGDSGGGTFLDYGGGEIVGAINSFVFDENDLDSNIPLDWTNGYWTVGTSVAAYEDWIKQPESGVFTNAVFAAAPVPVPPAVMLLASALLALSRSRLKQARD